MSKVDSSVFGYMMRTDIIGPVLQGATPPPTGEMVDRAR
jgi:hypothetical protein